MGSERFRIVVVEESTKLEDQGDQRERQQSDILGAILRVRC